MNPTTGAVKQVFSFVKYASFSQTANNGGRRLFGLIRRSMRFTPWCRRPTPQRSALHGSMHTGISHMGYIAKTPLWVIYLLAISNTDRSIFFDLTGKKFIYVSYLGGEQGMFTLARASAHQLWCPLLFSLALVCFLVDGVLVAPANGDDQHNHVAIMHFINQPVA